MHETTQTRIGTFALTLGAMSGGFLAILVCINSFILGRLIHLQASGAAQLATTIFLLTVFAISRGPQRAPRQLVLLDATATIGAGIGFSFIGWHAAPERRIELIVLLVVVHLLMVRAAMVPSPARRTAVIGVFTMVPILVQSALSHSARELTFERQPLGGPETSITFVLVYVSIWIVAAVIASSAISRKIYGLETQVEKTKRLGQYVLEEKIGEGGMGVVYRAKHALLRRATAIKLLPAEKAGEENVARFEREVHVTSALTHPNTVAVYDFGRTQDGVFYYAMEYLEGIDLDALVRGDGRQSPARVIHVLRQICGALVEAHAVGLIHRDIKPANVMLCQRGGAYDVAKVLDFGLVKRVSQDTQAESIAGTPLYMSPEAIGDPKSVGPASDLYALGAVAYFLLEGKDVFAAKTVVEVCAHHLHTKPRPFTAPVPAELARIVMACLEKAPEKRPASAKAMLQMLASCADAKAWGEEDASAWWTKNAALAKRRTLQPTPQSVTIDLDRHEGTA